MLLSRQKFNELVFRRDKYNCVVCGEPAVDAHHIIDRKCWQDGGYYLDNGCSLCSQCHHLSESGDYDPRYLREKAGIRRTIVPEGLSDNIDKWGTEMKEIYKYPRTMHLPWSDKLQNDDRRIESLDAFIGQEIICTEKMDGENTSMYRDYIHARSPSPMSPHPSRTRIKQLHDRIRHDIPEGWRICGENLYAKHSIHYRGLPSYFLCFGIYDKDQCLSWDETLEWCTLLDISTVPELYRGPWSPETIMRLYRSDTMWDKCEGYVVRVTRSFKYEEFDKVVAKYVRANHVQTDSHWMFKPVEPNETIPDVYY